MTCSIAGFGFFGESIAGVALASPWKGWHMRQVDLNRAVARATGETVSEVARQGFQLLDPNPVGQEQSADDDKPRDDRVPLSPITASQQRAAS